MKKGVKAKKVVCLGMTALLAVSGIQPGMVRADENVQEEEMTQILANAEESDWEYEELEDGAVVITGYNGNDTEVVIPTEISERQVTSIGDSAFYGYNGLTRIELPEGVTSIGDYAFYGCSGLTRIELPEGVTSIGDCAFKRCSGLTRIELPEGVTSIGDYAFERCSGLTEILVDENNIKYSCENGTLYDKEMTTLVCCPEGKIGDFYIPESVTRIGDKAFCGCSSLTSITIPENVTSIGDSAFYGCSGLTSIELPKGVTSIGDYTFERCSGVTSIELPEGVTSIGYSAFCECSRLTSIELPEGVTSIGDYAFEGCSGLTEILVDENNIKYCCENGTLYDKEMTTLVCCPGGKIGDFYIPESVTRIGDKAFCGCSSLTSITIPENVTSIGDYAFYGCSGLTSIELPKGVTSIGDYAFKGCSGVTSIELPEGVTSIGDYAFYGCSGLTSIELPKGVTSIGDSAFCECSRLTSIELPEGVTNIGDSAFYECSGLTSIELPEGVTNIGDYAFYECSGLTEILVDENNIKYSCENGTLYDKEMTTLVCCPEGKIGDFYIPESVTRIGDKAFCGCSSLTSITIPENVTSIGDYAFYECSGLTSINIPESVTYIANSAFWSCGDSSFVLYCVENFYAHIYAEENSIPYAFMNAIQNVAIQSGNDINITVNDYEKMSQTIYPQIADATVTVENFGNATTDVNGTAVIANTLTEAPLMNSKITVTKEGYRDYYFYNDIYNKDAELLWNGNKFRVALDKLQDGDDVNPYISTLMCQESYGRDFNIMQSKGTYNYGITKNVIFQMNAVWNGKTPSSYILYQKNGESYASADGKFTLNMGEAFEPGIPIYAKLVAEDGTTAEEETQIVIAGKKSLDSFNNMTLDLIDTDSTGMLGMDIAFLSGQDVSIKLSKVKIDISVEQNKVKATIGNSKTLSKGEVFDNEEWEDWKKLCEHQPIDLNLSQWKNVIESIEMPLTNTAKADTKVCGYLEGVINGDGETILTGKIKLQVSMSAGIQAQYTIGAIPIYAKVSIGVDGGAEGAFSYNLTEKKIETDDSYVLKLSLEPKLQAESGIGVMAVATVGVEGTGSMPFSTKIGTSDDTKASVKGKLALKAKLLCFEYSLDLVEKEEPLLPKKDSDSNNSVTMLSALTMDDFELEDRSYMEKESVWLGNDAVQLFDLETSETDLEERVLKTNISPNAEMQLVNTGTTKMILWTEQDAAREIVNGSKLVYSIYDASSDTWSEPLAVADDLTADYAPTAVTDGEKIYVAWQNMAEVFEADAPLSDVAATSTIAMSVWSPEDGFSNPVVVSKSDYMATSPEIALNAEGKPYVAYLQNTDNNLLFTSGKNHILYSVVDGSNIEYNSFVEDAGLVTAIDTAYMEGYEVSYTLDTDNNLSTLDDRELIKSGLVENSTQNDSIDSNAQYVTNGDRNLRFWYQNGSIYMSDEEGTESLVYQDETGTLTDDFHVISGRENQLAVIWTACDEENRKQIEGVLYNSTEDTWGKSIQISDTDASVYNPQGIFSEDGSLQFLYKKTGEQTDLCVLMAKSTTDLTIENAYCDETTFVNGETAKVSVQIKNNGLKTATGYTIDIDGTQTTFTDSLEPGTSVVVEADYAVPSDLDYRELSITVETDDEIETEDNTHSLVAGYSDLAVNLMANTYESGQLVEVRVANESCVDTAATLEIRKGSREGELVKTIDLGTLVQGEMTTATYLWNEDAENYANDIGTLYFDVVSEQEEKYTDNNYDFVVVENWEKTVDVTSISATKDKTEYFVGDELNVDDIHAEVTYSDGTTKEVTEYTTNVSEIDMTTAGEKTLEIVYEENNLQVTTEIAITVTEKTSEEPIIYTVTFDVNGGDNIAETQRNIEAGSAIGNLPEATREGYTFVGWYKATGGTAVTAETVVNEELILYARWEKIIEEIPEETPEETPEEDVTSGSCGENVNYMLEEDGTLIISGNGTMDDGINDSPFSAIKNDIEKIVIEEGVTSIGEYAFSNCSALTSIILPESITEIGEYVFWKCVGLTGITIPENVTSIGDFAFDGCENLTIYGKEGSYVQSYATQNNIPFCPIDTEIPEEPKTYVITFDANGGTGLSETERMVEANATIGLLPDVVREGYVFKGWYTQQTDGVGVSAETIVNENITLYARWEEIKKTYQVSFDANGGTGLTETERSVEADASIGELPTVTRSGYIFKGWYTDKTAGSILTKDTKVTGNMTIYARWVELGKQLITQATVVLAQTSCAYNGSPQEPSVASVKLGNVTLNASTDYSVTYVNNTNIGTATAMITGKGDYTGNRSVTFEIVAQKNSLFTVGAYKYKITSSSEVAFAGLKNKKMKKVTIPKTVKIGGKTFKVTSVAPKALRNTKVKSVIIGKNVQIIGAKAFDGCKNLGTVTVKSTKLKAIGKKAFKGIKTTAKIKVPKKKLSAYTKLFKGKGQSKKVKIVK